MNGHEPRKLCTGPAHAEPTWLPLTPEHWNFHRTGRDAGKPVARCRRCTNWSKLRDKDGPHGLIAPDVLLPLLRELVERCEGVYGVERAHGLRAVTLQNILEGTHTRVQKRTAAKVIAALAEQRRRDRRDGLSPTFVTALKARVENERRIETHGGW